MPDSEDVIRRLHGARTQNGWTRGLRSSLSAPTEPLIGVQGVYLLDDVRMCTAAAQVPMAGVHLVVAAPGAGLRAAVQLVAVEVPFRVEMAFLESSLPAGNLFFSVTETPGAVLLVAPVVQAFDWVMPGLGRSVTTLLRTTTSTSLTTGPSLASNGGFATDMIMVWPWIYPGQALLFASVAFNTAFTLNLTLREAYA